MLFWSIFCFLGGLGLIICSSSDSSDDYALCVFLVVTCITFIRTTNVIILEYAEQYKIT